MLKYAFVTIGIVFGFASLSSAQLVSNFSFANLLSGSDGGLGNTYLYSTSLPISTSRTNYVGPYGITATYSMGQTNTTANFETDCTFINNNSIQDCVDTSGYTLNPLGGLSVTVTQPVYYSFSNSMTSSGAVASVGMDVSFSR